MAFYSRNPNDRYELIEWLVQHIGEEFVSYSQDILGDHEGDGWWIVWDHTFKTYSVRLDDQQQELLCKLAWG